MTDDMLLQFDLPAVRRKKLTAGFDGGSLSSDGGLLLLREACGYEIPTISTVCATIRC